MCIRDRTDRQTDRQTETERERDRQTETDTNRQRHRDRDRKRKRKRDLQNNFKRIKESDRRINISLSVFTLEKKITSSKIES